MPERYTFMTLAGVIEPGSGFYDGLGAAARFNLPSGVAADNAGNVYVADSGNHTIRKINAAGMAMTLAGLAGEPGSTDGMGAKARFRHPQSLAFDSAGHLLVADTGNHMIRRIAPSGEVDSVAGLARSEGSNDGAGSAARFYSPSDLVVDKDDTIFVVDTENHTIRKITPANGVSTFAGLAGHRGSADGIGQAARFLYPHGLGIDTIGNLYVADTDNHVLRMITPAGVVTTVAGLAGVPGTADGIGNAARFDYPFGVAVDNAGVVYVADTYTSAIRRFASGTVSTLAGAPGDRGANDGVGSNARFTFPTGIATGVQGQIHVADTYNHLVRNISPGASVTTLAGLAIASGSIDGEGTAARFRFPNGIAVDAEGNLYVADSANHLIRKISPDGFVTTIAGTAGSPGAVDLSGGAARFNFPVGMAVDGSGHVYVADTYNHTIRKITPAGLVSTLAGLADNPGSSDGVGSSARFSSPLGLAVDNDGTLYVGDTWNHTIRKISSSGVVTTLAGSPGTLGSADGAGAAARFAFPEGVGLDGQGNVYVADDGNHTIRKISPSGVVTTLAGSPGTIGIEDGVGSAARFSYPFGLAVDADGNVYVADAGNQAIRKVDPSGLVSTIGGAVGLQGSTDGTGSDARFSSPAGIAVDNAGNLYISDVGSHSIRKAFKSPPDVPVSDPAIGRVGTARQLDVDHPTMTAWSWDIIRYPADSQAVLSSATARNPTLTPDIDDLFLIRMQGWDHSGHMAFGILSVESDVTPPTLSITTPSPGEHLPQPLLRVRGTAGDDHAVAAVWCQLNASDWRPASTIDGWSNWTTTLGLSAGSNLLRAFAMDKAGNTSATNLLTITSSSSFVLRLETGPWQSADAIDFSLEVSPGITGQIQVSHDLRSWAPFTEFDGSEIFFQFRDIAPTNSQQRFFRAVVP